MQEIINVDPLSVVASRHKEIFVTQLATATVYTEHTIIWEIFM